MFQRESSAKAARIAGAKAHESERKTFRSAEALLPPHKCGGAHLLDLLAIIDNITHAVHEPRLHSVFTPIGLAALALFNICAASAISIFRRLKSRARIVHSQRHTHIGT